MEERILNEKMNQPSFTVGNIHENRPTYNKLGELVWKKQPKRDKKYPQYPIEKIVYKDMFNVREDILEQTRALFKEIGELIPVCLNVGTLVNGYEQIVVAIENGLESVAFIEDKPTKAEWKARHSINKKRRKRERRNKKKAMQKRSSK